MTQIRFLFPHSLPLQTIDGQTWDSTLGGWFQVDVDSTTLERGPTVDLWHVEAAVERPSVMRIRAHTEGRPVTEWSAPTQLKVVPEPSLELSLVLGVLLLVAMKNRRGMR